MVDAVSVVLQALLDPVGNPVPQEEEECLEMMELLDPKVNLVTVDPRDPLVPRENRETLVDLEPQVCKV